MNDREDAASDERDTGLLGPEDASAFAELLDDGVARWDAATVLSGEEPSWFDLMERVRSAGPDPVFAALDDEELVLELGRRAASIAASTCRYVELVAELAVRRIWADHGARTPAQWLSFQLGIGASTAADHLRVGLRLRELPAVRAKFAEGRISYSKVRAITRIAVPEIEELLLNWAQWATGAEVERIVRAFRSTCHAADAASGPDQRREFRTRRNGDGTTTITVRVPDDEAAAIEASLDRLIDLEDRARKAEPSSAEEASTRVPHASGELARADSDADGADTDAAADTDGVRDTDADADGVANADADGVANADADGVRDTDADADGVRDADTDGVREADAADEVDRASGPDVWKPADDPYHADDAIWDGSAPSSAEDGDGSRPLGLEGLLALDSVGAGVEISFGRDGGAGGGRTRRHPSDTDDPEPVPLRVQQRTRGARRADALVDVCASASVEAGIDTSGLDRHTLVLHAQLADLQQPETATVPVDLAGGRTRSMCPRVLRRLACEAGVVLVATDGRMPIDVGRRQKRPTAAQRRALTVRDRSCRFPGCGGTRNLHAHHVVHWADDGPTDVANLVLICGFHHRFVHEHEWKVVPAAAGTFRFAPPSGDWLPPAGQPLEADAESLADRAPAELDGWALRPTHRWGGGDLDLHAAVMVLHQELLAVLPLVELDLAS